MVKNRGKTVIVILLSLFITDHQAQAQIYNQSITLFRGYDCLGQKVAVDTKVSTMFEWNDKAYSAAVSGAWLFYENADYNEGRKASMEYAFSATSKCLNFLYVGGLLSSARYAGGKGNYKKNSLTLYKNTYFQDEEEISYGDRKTLELKQHSSLIITGTSPWTLYDQPYHEGNSVCLFPDTGSGYSPFFIYDLKENIKLPYDSVRSVRLGCFDAKAQQTGFVSNSHGGLNGTL